MAAARRPAPSNARARRRIAVLLAAVTFAAHARVLGFDFVAWDDFAYVRDNPDVRQGLTANAVAWAFTSVHGGHRHPLTSLSHLLDCSLFGLDPWGHHLTSLVLHVLNTVILFGVLETMSGAAWPSAIVAALFGLHPLHVESVAWIADRKDLLGAFFSLLSLAAYAAYAKRPRAAPYGLALAFFACALLAKATAATLPALFLLLDYWPLDRLRPLADRLKEKMPFVALAAVMGASAVATVQGLPETIEHGTRVAMTDRVSNAAVSYVRYIGKTLWPTGLAILYPHPNLPGGAPWESWQIAGAVVILIAISAAVFAARGKRYLLVGWLWYAIGLFPVIGLLQIGPQAMADRYTYFPLIGLFVIAAWGSADLIERAGKRRPVVRRAFLAAAGVAMAACAAVTQIQAAHWKSSSTLFRHALDVAPDSPVLHSNLAVILRAEGKLDEAIDHYRAALRVQDDLPQTHYNLANALAARRDLAGAIEHYRRAVAADPRFVMAHYNLGGAYRSERRFAEAAESYGRALEIRPDFYQAQNDLGFTLHSMGRLDEAVAAYRAALGLHPSSLTHRNLAKALAAQGRMDEANEEMRKAAIAPSR